MGSLFFPEWDGGDGWLAFFADVYNSNTSEHDRQTCGTRILAPRGCPVRRIRYQEIAAELRELAASSPAGSLLPSESELSARFGASRVTVRRALELVKDEGLVAARQGFGWFVATEPVRQRLEHLGTIEDQLEGGGRHAERRVVEFAFTRPPSRVAAVLGVEQVLRVKRLNLADGEPFAVVTVWCPADLGRSLSREDVERRPFYELLGIPLRGATQTIGADAAEAADAELLGVPVGAPLLRCQRVTTDTTGHPILLSDHLYPAHRTEFVVELPLAEPSTTPAGLRLVD
jgi:GntR family transcriptional regulator